MEMERNSIAEVNAAARSRRMSYGEYVGAAYYPVTIVQVMPDGGRILRTAPVPEPVTTERPLGADPVEQLQKEKKPEKPKKERQCVVCGRVLGRYQRKYCSDGCEEQLQKQHAVARYCTVCGEKIQGLGRIYCSKCTGEGYRRQARERERKRRMERAGADGARDTE